MTNHLKTQESPYLLQHAENPVHWYPWCDEAFQTASQRNCPIFLSIGYSTCHWCHVMEKESFNNQEIAQILNDNFVSIKVDREERPDIDEIYMMACQTMTGFGGWPLTVICTPQGKPFFVGTYFPPTNQNGRPGLKTILETAAQKWRQDALRLEKIGQQIITRLARSEPPTSPGNQSLTLIDTALQDFKKAFDPQYGGFGDPPKFPTPHYLLFLLQIWSRKQDPELRTMIETTLDGMYRGGIFDHIGFGFCRYSIDKRWLVPHFEKLLYDNALLCMAYLEAYQAFGNEQHKKVAQNVLTYLLRDMQHRPGGFYSAEDADSEGVEGKYYLWGYEEVLQALGQEQGHLFCEIYNISKTGNFNGANIPNLIGTPNKANFSEQQLEELRETLFAVRNMRPHPFKDDKILTSWNGLMIGALAKGTRILEEPTYLEAAEKAVQFIFKNLQNENGRLFARYRKSSGVPGFLDDYAFLIWGLLELYETTFKKFYLEQASSLAKKVLEMFTDFNGPGFFFAADDVDNLPIRPKKFYDEALPSGNSVMAWNMLRLHNYLPDHNWGLTAERLLKEMQGAAERYPMGYAMFLTALDYGLSPVTEIKITGPPSDPVFQRMIQLVQKVYLPHSVLRVEEDRQRTYTDAMVCTDSHCLPPIRDPSILENTIKKTTSS